MRPLGKIAVVGGLGALGLLVWLVWCVSGRIALRERTDAVDRLERRHQELVAIERPRAVALMSKLRAELGESSIPEWAGDYSWTLEHYQRHGDTRPPTIRQEGIVLGPRGDVVWWLGDGSSDTWEMVDVGHVVSASADEIVVDWRINREVPHRYPRYDSPDVLSGVLVRVQWDGGEYLVPSTRMGCFLAIGCEARHVDWCMAPKKGGWNLGTDGGAIMYSSDPSPQVPARWRKWVNPPLVEATAALVEGPELIYFRDRRGPEDGLSVSFLMPWSNLGALGETRYRLVYEVPLAAGQELLLGTPMVVGGRRPTIGFVTSSTGGEALVEIQQSGFVLGLDGPWLDREFVSNRYRRDP